MTEQDLPTGWGCISIADYMLASWPPPWYQACTLTYAPVYTCMPAHGLPVSHEFHLVPTVVKCFLMCLACVSFISCEVSD